MLCQAASHDTAEDVKGNGSTSDDDPAASQEATVVVFQGLSAMKSKADETAQGKIEHYQRYARTV